MKSTYLIFLSAFLLIAGSEVFGQVTTASISGKITDTHGEALPGSNVIAIHNPTGTQYGTSTRVDGRFNLPNLRVGGPYTVTVSFVGFKESKLENITLTLGQNLNFDFELLEESTALEEVVITAESGDFDDDKTGYSQSYDNTLIRKMPTITRSSSDIYRLTPSSDGNSFGGRNDQFNNFSLDGSIFNNPFGLDAATPGGQTDAQPISLDAIDQIQVSVAPYDVTMAGFTGASINAVTKSGTNKVSGTVFGFFRNDGLTGSKVNGEEIIVPELNQLQTGFSIGGPIIKNKLFFFANMEIERRDDQGSSFIANRGQSGENVSRVDASDLEAVSSALSNIGYETGAFEGYTHETNNQKGIVKLDWNINQNNTLTATYNFLDASKQKPAHPTALGRRGPDATTLQFFNSGYQINNKIHSGLIELRSLLGTRFSNKFQAGYTFFDDSRDPFSTPAPVININRAGSRYIVAGHEPFSINNRLEQRVLQFTDNFDVYAGKHTFTFGTSFERFDFDNSFNLGVYEPFGYPYPGGTFGPGFDSVQDFLDYVSAGNLDTVFVHANNTFNNNNSNDSWALAETNVGQWALYAQDKFQVTDDFTLTLGVRMDLPLYFDTSDKIAENIERKGGLWDPANNSFGNYQADNAYFDEDGNSLTFDHTVLPKQKPLISPRLGFNWDVNGEQTLQIRGGTGLFTGRLPFVWIGNQVANPDFFFYTMTADDFKFPQVWRTSVGFDKTLGEGIIFTFDGSFTKDINGMIVRNYGLNLPSQSLAGGADTRPFYVNPDDRAIDAFGGATNAYVFTNTDIGQALNLTFELKRRWADGLYTSIAYNFLDNRDASSIEAEISGDAFAANPIVNHANVPVESPSAYGNKHRVVGNIYKSFIYAGGKSGTTISLFFEYARGGRYSYTYAGDINNDGSGLNDLLYIPTESELSSMNFTSDAERNAYGDFIDQDEYLSENRGSFAEAYGALSPWYSRFDLRVLQDLNLSNGHSFQFSIDLLNAGNFISSEWGVRQFPTNNQPVGVTVDPATRIPTYSFDTNLTDSFTTETGLISRWQLQFGLRYSF